MPGSIKLQSEQTCPRRTRPPVRLQSPAKRRGDRQRVSSSLPTNQEDKICSPLHFPACAQQQTPRSQKNLPSFYCRKALPKGDAARGERGGERASGQTNQPLNLVFEVLFFEVTERRSPARLLIVSALFYFAATFLTYSASV